MSPDSPDTRLRALEQDVAALKQKAEDLADDVRAFAPLVATQAGMRATIEHMANDIAEVQRGLGDLRRQLEAESEERRKGQEARSRETRANRTLLWVAAIGLIGTFVSSTAVVIAAVL